jgi:diguanylate cyclase (GGDEF)-like protein
VSALARLRVAFRWALLAAVAIGMLSGLRISSQLRFAERRVGISIETSDAGGLIVLDTLEDGPAARAGLRAGDRLISLEGQPLREEIDFDRVAEGFRSGRPIRLEIVRQGQTVEASVVPGVPVSWRDVLLDLLVTALYAALGLLAATRGEPDRRATLLAAFSFAVAFELALPVHLVPGTFGALATAVAYRLVTGLQFGLELHLASLIPTEMPWLARRRGFPGLTYAIGLALGGFAAVATTLDQVGVAHARSVSTLADSVLLDWMLPVWAVLVTVLIGSRVVTHEEPRGRHQAALVLLGLLPWVAVVLDDVASRLFEWAPEVPDVVWSLALLVYPVAIFAAIFLYQLFDLELVVKKTFVYGTLTTLLVLVFYALVGAGGALFARQFEGEAASVWVVSAATLAMGLLFNPLRTRLENLIDRKIFPERQELRSRLVALAAELPAQGKLPRMGEHLARELARSFAVEPVTVWIAAPPQGQLVELASAGRAPREDLERTALIGAEDPVIRRLTRDGRPTPAQQLAEASPAMAERFAASAAELAVPLVAQERMVGLVLLGHKRDGTRYVGEELELLEFLSHHVATVFENARLFDSATFEGLTGLYRRETILEILDREWSRSQRYDRPLAVAVADLDRFKQINDRFGHLSGDLVLQRVASELAGMLRETDFIGRFGGEEFLVVLPETGLEGARGFAEKARRRLEEIEIRMENGERVRVTVSCGVASRAEVRGDARTRARALLAAADEALYAAKNAGRNRVEVAVAPGH